MVRILGFFFILLIVPAFAGTVVWQTAKPFQEVVGAMASEMLVEQFRSALRCSKPGERSVPYEMDDTPATRLEYGARCNENGYIHAYNSGVNQGLIPRMQAAGFPVQWIRAHLAKPENLKWVQDNMSNTIQAIVVASMTGEYSLQNVFGEDGVSLNDHAKESLRGFVRRRIAEAALDDRAEIARLWGEIISEQVKYLGRQDDLIPEFLR